MMASSTTSNLHFQLLAKVIHISSLVVQVQEIETTMDVTIPHRRVNHDLAVRSSNQHLVFVRGSNSPFIIEKMTKAPGLPRAQTEQPSRPFDIDSPQFKKEYESMSADMKAYVRGLGFDPQDSLNERMANVTLDDPGLRASRSPESYGRRTPDVPPKGKNVARGPEYYEEYEEDEEDEEDEDQYDSANGGRHQRYSSSYTHNDNRVITKHI